MGFKRLQKNNVKKDITIIGAGLVGSLLSIYLSKKGHKVKVFERRGDMRKEKMIAGRSINLALSDRGIRALEEVASWTRYGRYVFPCMDDLFIIRMAVRHFNAMVRKDNSSILFREEN